MITKASFRNFRGYHGINLSNLSRITLISGKNNVGKTSLLEGIFLLFDHASPDSFMKIANFRGVSTIMQAGSLWEPFFYNLDTRIPIEICITVDDTDNHVGYVRDDNFVPTDSAGAPKDVWEQFVSAAKTSYTLKFDYFCNDYRETGHFIIGPAGIMRNAPALSNATPKPNLPTVIFVNSTIMATQNPSELMGRLELEGKKQEVIKVLQMIDPDITDITTIALSGQTQLYARTNNKLLPLKVAGDGINRLLYLILSIAANPGSIILVDEIETGFHYSMYSNLWAVLSTAAKESNCQIIATTHSYECIDGAVSGTEKAGLEDEFSFYRIEHIQGKSSAYRYDSQLLRVALNKNMEIR